MKKSLVLLFFLLSITFANADSQKVEKFGAVGDGKTDNTEAIQKAIDKCSETGGGEVFFPNGKVAVYMSKTLNLKDNVALNIPKNVTLKAIIPETRGVFIKAEKVKNVGIWGGGTVDCDGKNYTIPKDERKIRARAHSMKFIDCYNIRIENLSVLNGGAWNINLLRCDTVFVNRIRLLAHANHNNDGIDIDARNVVISDCIIDCGDDGICFKSHSKDFIVENVTVTNCIVASTCNFIKFGTGSLGGFKNITISNCTLRRCIDAVVWDWRNKIKWAGIDEKITGISGIALEAVDGGFMEQVNISNIAMTGVQTPIFIRVGHRNKDEKKSYIQNVVISSITAKSDSCIANSITCVEGHTLRNITIRDCYLNMKGAPESLLTNKEKEPKIQEMVKSYPENRMFASILPAYAFFIRRADNLVMDNVQVGYYGEKDKRAAFYLDKCKEVRFLNCVWQKPAGDSKSIVTKDSQAPFISYCREKEEPYLQ